MLTAHRMRSLVVAVLAVVGLGISSPAPAFAATLTVTDLSCETLVSGFRCDAYVSGGIPPYTYTWNIPYKWRSDSTNGSSILYSCAPGYSVTVTFTVRDKAGATASRSQWVYCSGGTP